MALDAFMAACSWSWDRSGSAMAPDALFLPGGLDLDRGWLAAIRRAG